jgi:hypothetical protein
VQVIQRAIDTGMFENLSSPGLPAFGVIGLCVWSNTWLTADAGKAWPRGEMFVRRDLRAESLTVF